ncbi:hypothetical protein Scel_69530 [Streptomyces cellostaticus]|nr:hypothetical protein Scel_69530 [Streptomyces cellostaticus]
MEFQRASTVELAGPGLLLPLYGLALLLTAAALVAQRAVSASRTAARSPSDANPA